MLYLAATWLFIYGPFLLAESFLSGDFIDRNDNSFYSQFRLVWGFAVLIIFLFIKEKLEERSEKN